MKKITALLLLSFSCICLQAQTNLDSLYTVWEDYSKPDSIRVDAYYYYIGNGFLNSQPDSAFTMSERLIAFSKKKNYPKGEAKGLNFQGILYYSKGNYPKALGYWNRSLKVYEEVGDKKGIANTVANIGNVYGSQGNSTKALEYYFRSLKIFEEIDGKRGIVTSTVNIGNIYSKPGTYQIALEYLSRSLKLSEEIGDEYGISSNLINLGFIYEKQGKYSIALECYNRSLKFFEKAGDKNGISRNLYGLGVLYNVQGETLKAIEYCKQGLALAEKIGVLEPQKDNCQCLYDAYKAIGNGNMALMYLEKMHIVEDSLNIQETTKKLELMEFAKQVLQDSIAQAETDRLVLEAHQEEMRVEEKTRNIGFGIGGLVLLLAGGLYTRLRYVRRSKAIIEEEKDRSNNLLLNILPADIAEELKIYGKAEARDFDMVSILFTDFKGFTEASSKMSAGMLVAEINTCFEAFDGICEKYKVEKIKTIGDAYMAAGGLPIPTDDSVKNTVLAALEMQDFISKRKKESDADGKPAFEMRVGIHTGPVVAGIVGVKKFQYDIWGDTVNTASRIESNGEAGKVNISQSTYELIKGDPSFYFESRGKIEAKGKGEMEMWFVKLT